MWHVPSIPRALRRVRRAGRGSPGFAASPHQRSCNPYPRPPPPQQPGDTGTVDGAILPRRQPRLREGRSNVEMTFEPVDF